jgi:hypothetical protein
MAAMVGGMTMARATKRSSPGFSDEILAAMRDELGRLAIGAD